MKAAVAVTTAFLLASCAPPVETPGGATPLDTPAVAGSAQPNLVSGADGRLYLSWVETTERGHALRFSRWDGNVWSVPRPIARGGGWFVNWADFPSMGALEDGTLAAHWLAKVGEATYAYGVLVSFSDDGGESWSAPLVPHTDGTETEHGFVSLVPRADRFVVVWLDGRETERRASGEAGAMTLRAATVGADGSRADEVVIDPRVCDCCPTDAVVAGDGKVVAAYRDRSDTEVRDIKVSRLEPGGWTKPQAVHDDRWEIAGCPVNGPALAASGDRVACAWYTEHEEPAVLLAFSDDGARSFASPTRVDDGDPLGRCDVELLDDGSALVSWLERSGEVAEIRIRRIFPSGRREAGPTVARVADSRAAGFPRMVRHGGEFFLAWTEPGEPSRVRSAKLH